jgi:hypothetical protein
MQLPQNAADGSQAPARKPYHPPKLEAAGDFRKLTLVGSGGGNGGSDGNYGSYGNH